MLGKFYSLAKQPRIKDFILFSTASFVSAFIGIITLPYFTEYMTPYEFGIWNFVLTMNSFLAPLIVLDLHSFFLIESTNKKADKNALLSTLLTFSFLWSMMIIVVFLALGGSFFHYFFADIRFNPYVSYILLSNLFVCFPMFLLILYRIDNKPVSYFVFSLLQSLLTVIPSLALVIFLWHDSHGRLLGYSLGTLATGILAMVVIYRRYAFRFRIDRAIIGRALKFSTPLIPYSIALLSMDFLDRVFIEKYCSINELGFFGLAFQLNSIIYIVFLSLIRVYEPSLIGWLGEEKSGPVFRFSFNYNLLLVAASICVILLSGFVITQLSNPKYHDATSIVIKLAPFFYLKTIMVLVLTLLISSYQTFKTMYVTICMFGLNVLFGVLYIPKYGIDGMIVVKTSVSLLGCGALFFFLGFRKEYLKLAIVVLISMAVIFALSWLSFKYKFYF